MPEFTHKAVYDGNHRTRLFTHRSDDNRLLQKGLRDRLLCDECEQRFSVYERYFSQLWYHSNRLPERFDSDYLNISDVDYPKLKLLLLSIIWRASVSTHPDFSAASLGVLHEGRIRRALLDEDPGPETAYPVLAGLVVDSATRRLWDGLLLQPIKVRVQEHWAHMTVFAGVSWKVVTSSHFTIAPEYV